MTPTLVTSYQVDSGASSNTTALTTPSFTPSSGEIIVVKRMTWDSGNPYAGAPSGGSLTYASRASSTAGSTCYGDIYTAVGAGASMTVSSGALSSAAKHSMVVERWSGAQLAATPATNSTKTGGPGTAPSATLVTVASNSIVTSLCGDWDAASPAGRAYRSSATEDGQYGAVGDTEHYYMWQTAAASGTQTIGMTAPNQRWTLLGIEVQDSGGGGPALPPELIMQTMRTY